ncbi:MAG: thiamine pyrophosphate-dependent enzyme [Coriobacteriia bacterium]|jgi:2-oxoglutarate ferredoxin oxidoreductase subunit beta|nr:thiamine pyrophosphate-dependent enzyme [Coriobacteriia bacterium]
MPEVNEYITPNKPTWCPGCGNHNMFEALKHALSELDMDFHEYSMVWGIGCHGNGADFLKTQGFHALHGRALPVATGLSLTRPDLKVIVEMGDGDGYGLGLGHFIHSVRRNVDLTCIAHNNQIYGLTTGQASPTTEHLMRTVSTPEGVLEQPVNPLGLALAEGASFVARGFAGDVPHLTELYKQAIQHKGFALVDVFQRCVTWNKLNTFSWFRERVYELDSVGHDPTDLNGAFELSMTTFHEMTCKPHECRVPIGIFYRDESAPTYNQDAPGANRPGYEGAKAVRDIADLIASYA